MRSLRNAAVCLASVATTLSVVSGLVAVGCGGSAPSSLLPQRSASTGEGGLVPASFAAREGALDAGVVEVDASLVTTGRGPAVVARRTPPPEEPTCAKAQRGALSFVDRPVYPEKVERDAPFVARLFVGNAGSCTRRVTIPLGFTPPRTTATRTVDFTVYVPPKGVFVDLRLEADELTEANVTPGRYALTFAVLDEEGGPVGRPSSGNAFRIGKDEIVLPKKPELPGKIGLAEDLVVPLVIQNVGDTANRVTPLIVFTRPGETVGIEHYDPPTLVVPGVATHTFRLSREAREAEKIGPGPWLVTITVFDAAGDRMSSFAGLPLAIGTVDLRLPRPDLPVRVKATEPVRATFRFENKGDTADKVTCVVAFTRPGSTATREVSFVRDVPPGGATFDAVVDVATRKAKGIGGGVWLVTTAAFRGSGERIKSFTGHYLEIED